MVPKNSLGLNLKGVNPRNPLCKKTCPSDSIGVNCNKGEMFLGSTPHTHGEGASGSMYQAGTLAPPG